LFSIIPGGPPPTIPAGQQPCNLMWIQQLGPNLGIVNQQPTTLDEFSKSLARILGRAVINKTGIAGQFAFYMEFAIDQSTPGMSSTPAADLSSAPSIFTAIQTLGLKLDASKGPGEFLVIESVQRPSEN
jgi:uncharacterized protein (TIGR03435 family)